MVAIAAVLTVFGGRLVQLQGFDSSAYAAQAEQQRLQHTALPATRGSILDRNGVELAASVDARAVYADPSLVKDPQTTAVTLSPLLGVSSESLAEKMSDPKVRFVYLAHQLSPADGKRVLALNLPGIGLEPESKRVYPGGELAANVIGFVGADGHGLGGLEYAYDSRLSGTPGKLTQEIGRDGRAIPSGADVEKAPVPGQDLMLTIDRDIQWEAQQAITAQVAATGADSGTVIVMNPRTGQVLAMATAPSFDPSDPGASPAADRGNRPLRDVYEPGSTNKVITFAAALETGAITPTTPVTVPPTLDRANHTFHDAEVHGVENLTAAGVLAESSNIGTILISEKVGKDALYRFLKAFGFGDPTGIGYPGESGGILPPASKWNATQQYTIPFGQGVSVTAMQVASVYATVANDGVRVQPTLISGFRGPDGSVTALPAPQQRRVISAKTAEELRMMLEGVVSDQGTAPAAEIAGYRVAGKTGTAQRVDPTCGCYRGYTASFVGFAPADNPQVVTEVVLQNPVRGHYGGSVAAPVFHDVTAFALQSLRIPPTGTQPPVLQLTAP
jgi:cell division protein FtsI (penicillin-binding protein 3)